MIETDPGSGDEGTGVADKPGVAVIVGRAGFACGGFGEVEAAAQGLAGAVVDDVLEDAGDLEGDLGREDAAGFGFVFVENFAGFAANFGDEIGFVPDSAVGEGGVEAGQFGQG